MRNEKLGFRVQGLGSRDCCLQSDRRATRFDFKQIYLLLVICYLLLVIGCPPFIDNNETPIAPGMGRVSLRFSDRVGRSIYPNTPALNYFEAYRLYFNADDATLTDPGVTANQWVAADTSVTSQDLVPGDYYLTVFAYKTAGTPNLNTSTGLAAQSDPITITIEADETVTHGATILLKALLNGTATDQRGSFTYNLALNMPGITVSSAKMTCAAINLDVTFTGATAASSETGTLSNLTPGIYTVTFEIQGTAGTSGTVGYEVYSLTLYDLLYIYNTLESRLPLTGTTPHTFTSADLIRQNVVVTFIGLDPDAPATSTYKSFLYGSKLTSDTSIPGDPPGYAFDGYYRTYNSTTGAYSDLWIISDATDDTAGRIHNDMTLYVKWDKLDGKVKLDDIAVQPIEITFAYNALDSGGTAVATNPISITQGISSPITVTLTSLTVDGAAINLSTATISWKIAGVGAYSDVTQTGGLSYNLVGTNYAYNTPGRHYLEVTVTVGANQYLERIPFNVVAP